MENEKAVRDARRTRLNERDAKQAGAAEVKTVLVNTGDSNSEVVERATSYGLHIGLDQHGQAYEVTFPNGAKVKADDESDDE